MSALDHLCARDNLDEFLQPEPVEYPLEVRNVFVDTELDMCRLLNAIERDKRSAWRNP